MLALAQAFLVQDPIKVLLISFVSPAFWARCLKPGTKRAEALRAAMQFATNALQGVL